MKKKFKITNSLGGKKIDFKPQKEGHVLFYSCGPTVYGPLHIGNARALVTSDLFFRWLQRIGYEVNYVRNYTDVDDKIIHKAKEENRTSEAVAQHYLEYAEEDMRLLGLRVPTKTAKVTESIDEIISLVESLVQKGFAYAVNGEVLFSIEKFKEYGKLSGKKIEDLLTGVRIEVGDYKKNALDFSLWKKQKPGEPFWKSPWGEGRPGWHIECSAMAKKWLGETIDLHHGGQDLIFPHHENEIAQSECGNGKTFCNHWVHNAFLTMRKEKMSKSLGNILTIREFIQTYGAETLCYIFNKHHYRSPIDFSDQLISESLQELERIYLAKKWAVEALKDSTATDATQDLHWKDLAKGNAVITAMEDELFNDLNTPGALSHLFTWIRAINKAEASGSKAPAKKKVAQEFAGILQKFIPEVLNIGAKDPMEMLKAIDQVRKGLLETKGTGISEEEILKLIEERNQARKEKNFARGDEIRKELDALGVVILDSPRGTTFKYK